jgi:MSHA pilin protein MshD
MYNKHSHRQRGLTIIELIMFMVIMGVAAAGIMQVLNMASTNTADPIRRKQAMLVAEAYMEEVQLASFTACDPADANASTATIAAVATVAGDTTRCAADATVEKWGPEVGNVRPFDNINDYVRAVATGPISPTVYVPGTPVRAFATKIGANLVDTDVAGNALGNGVGASMAGITTTLALTPVSLGPFGSPGGRTVVANNTSALTMEALQITIITTYGSGPNDSIRLDGYRTRYAPNYTP